MVIITSAHQPHPLMQKPRSLLIGRLLISVLEAVFDRTSRHFRENRTGSRPNQIYLKVSMGWGLPQPSPVDAQPPRETAPAE